MRKKILCKIYIILMRIYVTVISASSLENTTILDNVNNSQNENSSFENGSLFESDSREETFSSKPEIMLPTELPNFTDNLNEASNLLNVDDTTVNHLENDILSDEMIQNFKVDTVIEENPKFKGGKIDSERNENDINSTLIEIVVRKCCPVWHYFDTNSNTCAFQNESNIFDESILNILKDKTNVIKLSSGFVQCLSQPSTNHFGTDNTSHVILNDGQILDISLNQTFNHSQYCLEMLGEYPNAMTFMLAYCPKIEEPQQFDVVDEEKIPNNTDYVLPKCCPVGKYFDEDKFDCLSNPSWEYPYTNLLLNYNIDNYRYATKSLGDLLACHHIPNSFPEKELAENFHFQEGKLCLHGECYDLTDYCIDYLGSIAIQKLQAIAFYCRRYSYFIKCCGTGEVLDGSLCVTNSATNSILIEEMLSFRSSVQAFNYKECLNKEAIFIENNQWQLGQDGSYIVVESNTEVDEIINYCIDDLKQPDGNLQPIAFVCKSDLEKASSLESAKPEYIKRPGSLGKCCPASIGDNTLSFFSSLSQSCEVATTNSSIDPIEYLTGFNFTTEHYYDFPKCSGSVGYHSYIVNSSTTEDGIYVTFIDEGNLLVVSTNGKCVQNEQIISDRDYCFEYSLADKDNPEPMVFICANATVEQIYDERFGLMTALLALSCVCLLYTFISLFTTRVRRGIVSVRKVNTLAGKILVSFVGSHLIGFVSLSIAQFENSVNKANSPSCYALAGFIEFFNLATFCWNTSICLESLLLTINIRIPEWTRYFLHSLWAWGFPFIMTLLMFLMDANRENLSCAAIIPNVGIQHCFIFGTAAKLVYFYIPILITLTANIVFLVGAKLLRNARLKRLERGIPSGGDGSKAPQMDEDGKPVKKQSGMRLHQNQNVKAESFRLVLWTGGTWFLELAGFVSSRYILQPQHSSWFYYFWYIPTSLNALRGVGIFTIIVLTPEVRKKGGIAITRIKRRLTSRIRKLMPNYDPSKSDGETDSSDKSSSRMTIISRFSSVISRTTD